MGPGLIPQVKRFGGKVQAEVASRFTILRRIEKFGVLLREGERARGRRNFLKKKKGQVTSRVSDFLKDEKQRGFCEKSPATAGTKNKLKKGRIGRRPEPNKEVHFREAPYRLPVESAKKNS